MKGKDGVGRGLDTGSQGLFSLASVTPTPGKEASFLSRRAHKTAAWQQDGGGEGILKQFGGASVLM